MKAHVHSLSVDLTRGRSWWRVRARGEDSGDVLELGELKIVRGTQRCVQILDSNNFVRSKTVPVTKNIVRSREKSKIK